MNYNDPKYEKENGLKVKGKPVIIPEVRKVERKPIPATRIPKFRRKK